MRTLNLLLVTVFCVSTAFAADKAIPGETITLWPAGETPLAKGTGKGHEPTLTISLPYRSATNTGVGVVVCPGGGYGHLAVEHEGWQVAAWLNAHGIAAFVLQYRHAPDYGEPVPLMDAHRAIRTVRHRAEEWKVDPDKIGVLGFSAGGHLTTSTAVHWNMETPLVNDAIDQASARPNFVVPVYPVVTMTDPHTHKGSRKNLLGKDPSPELIETYSNEKQVNKDTPPAFIVHTGDDSAVPVQNALLFYEAYVNAGVPAELHVLETGRHGLGLGGGNTAFAQWPDLCLTWLRTRGLLD